MPPNTIDFVIRVVAASKTTEKEIKCWPDKDLSSIQLCASDHVIVNGAVTVVSFGRRRRRSRPTDHHSPLDSFISRGGSDGLSRLTPNSNPCVVQIVESQ